MRSAILAALLLSSAPMPADVPIPPDHVTKAELTGFRSAASYDETVDFLLRLTRTSPYLHVEWFGATGEGRRMPLVVMSKERAFTPAEAAKVKKPIVLVVNSIHGGEMDGTDASLMLLRDVALRNRDDVLDAVTLLVIPIYNVDGHERFDRNNRPNQNGPVEGMGLRTTARGYDLNRDWLKADSPEARAVLAVVDAWRPDLAVDDHVTDGILIQPALTTTVATEPTSPPVLAQWIRKLIPKVTRSLDAAGHKTGPHVEQWLDPLDPTSGFDTADGGGLARFSSGYFPLRGIPAILVETHAPKPFAERVKANAAFLASLAVEVKRDAGALFSAREKARLDARRAPPGTPIVLDGELDKTRPEPIDYPGYAWKQITSFVTGKPALRYDTNQPIAIRMPAYWHLKPTVTVPRPAAYIVRAGWPDIAERLDAHGIKYRKLEAKRTLPVGTYRAEAPAFAPSPYQGATRVTARIARATETLEIPAGSLYVPLDTELAPVVMHLLEPEGPDSLFAWGKLSTVLELKEYIDTRVLDPLAEEMLAKDPALKAEWEKKLEDPKFADDGPARYRFLYSRSKHWERSFGLLPIYRLDALLPE